MRIVIKLTVLVMVGASVILAAQVQLGASAAEQQLFASVNQARRAQGQSRDRIEGPAFRETVILVRGESI